MLIQLTHDPIEPTALLAAVSHPHCGATALFLGTVRELTHGETTLALAYEAYLPMAEAKLKQIAQELCPPGGPARLAIVHRLGQLEIGEVAVAVAVATPHRAEAFELCRFAMERIKAEVPIWKKDFTPTGESAWIHPKVAQAKVGSERTP